MQNCVQVHAGNASVTPFLCKCLSCFDIQNKVRIKIGVKEVQVSKSLKSGLYQQKKKLQQTKFSSRFSSKTSECIFFMCRNLVMRFPIQNLWAIVDRPPLRKIGSPEVWMAFSKQIYTWNCLPFYLCITCEKYRDDFFWENCVQFIWLEVTRVQDVYDRKSQ